MTSTGYTPNCGALLPIRSLREHSVLHSTAERHTVLVHPVSTVVHAVELVLDLRDELGRNVLGVAAVEGPLVEIRAQDGEEEEKERGNDQHVPDVWHSVDERVHGNTQARVSRDHPQRP